MNNCQICGDFAILIMYDEKIKDYVGYCHEHSPYSKTTPEQEARRKQLWGEHDKRYTRVEEEYADYLAVLKAEQDRTNTCGPHCDSWVLHPMDDCRYCADYPALHHARWEMRIAYTGIKPVEGERPCPAERMRTLEVIERWSGNVAFVEGVDE